MNADPLERARHLLRGAERVVALTGAGISTESGIPDYRGPQGIWTRNPKAERMSTIEYYLGDPEVRQLAWQMRRDQAVWRRRPNAGHRALVDLERAGRLDLLATQNVDGLHLAAGISPERLVELHGNVRQTECVACGDRDDIEIAIARVDAGEPDPACTRCGGILKTAVVYFGEALDADDIDRAMAASGGCDLFLALGTSLQVHPAAGLPQLAAASGASVVIVNAEPTVLDGVADVVVHAKLGDVLPGLVDVAV